MLRRKHDRLSARRGLPGASRRVAQKVEHAGIESGEKRCAGTAGDRKAAAALVANAKRGQRGRGDRQFAISHDAFRRIASLRDM
jgi:hypothetical protein